MKYIIITILIITAFYIGITFNFCELWYSKKDCNPTITTPTLQENIDYYNSLQDNKADFIK